MVLWKLSKQYESISTLNLIKKNQLEKISVGVYLVRKLIELIL